jgi:hypothetical protein
MLIVHVILHRNDVSVASTPETRRAAILVDWRTRTPIKLAQVITVVTCIREVLVSNLGQNHRLKISQQSTVPPATACTVQATTTSAHALSKSFQPHYGPEVDSASNINTRNLPGGGG